jgi:hypothetical protein
MMFLRRSHVLSLGSNLVMPLCIVLAISQRAVVARAFDRPVFSEDYRLLDDPDETLSLQRAGATGRMVSLLEGKTYSICASIPLQGLTAPGKGATIKACGNFAQVPGERENLYSFVTNPNWSAPSIVDTHIHISNITFDATNIRNKGAFHAIEIRSVRDIVIDHVTCLNVGDCTALQADDNTIVSHSRAYGIRNVGFDHWEGPRNALLLDSVAYCGRGGDGVMFTAAGTSGLSARGGSLVARNIEVVGPCLVGVDINTLGLASGLEDVTLENISIDQQHGNGLGIRITGNTVRVNILNPIIKNLDGGQAVAVVPDRFGAPSEVVISHPLLTMINTSNVNVAAIALLGARNKLIQPAVSGVYPYLVWLNDNSTLIEGGRSDPGVLGYAKISSPLQK